ncbi:MAG: tRNA pseudouridine(38-40) synthase TruA [Deltaproteobacteria bacterium]|nr:tRNA pseudouridine(38-40) synthase TruA [Deltaproteobacteria bacterium]
MKIKLTIKYNGAKYLGWQRQKTRPTIQRKIEEALYKIFHQKVIIYGASRTDAGVHAEGQVAHFTPPPSFQPTAVGTSWNPGSPAFRPLNSCVQKINSYLPEDIRIVMAEEVQDSFHAREDSVSKLYEYSIFNGKNPTKKDKTMSWWRPKKLNILLMNEACGYLIGEHDFRLFQTSGSRTKTTFRTILEAAWRQEEDFLVFKIQGTGFLKHMIRNIVGAMYLVGSGQINPAHMIRGPTAPACGLSLKKIFYF